jgi:peptide/nickel transport system ATP-binding protein
VAARLQVLDAFNAVRAADASMALIMVSHDLGVVQHIADRILVLHDGHVVEYGSRNQILGSPQTAYTKRLIEAAML